LLRSTLAALFFLKTELPVMRQQLARLNFTAEVLSEPNISLTVVNYLNPSTLCYDAQTVLPWLKRSGRQKLDS
jgi:hypothetical protein